MHEAAEHFLEAIAQLEKYGDQPALIALSRGLLALCLALEAE